MHATLGKFSNNGQDSAAALFSSPQHVECCAGPMVRRLEVGLRAVWEHLAYGRVTQAIASHHLLGVYSIAVLATAVATLSVSCVATIAPPETPIAATAIVSPERITMPIATGRALLPSPSATLTIVSTPTCAPTCLPAAKLSPIAPKAPTQPLPTPLFSQWPLAPLTGEQLKEVRDCDLGALSDQRYPQAVSNQSLPTAYQASSACDWAALAVAYAKRMEQDMSLFEIGRKAEVEAIRRNPAFGFSTLLVYSYWGTTPLVEAPPFAKQEITAAEISYSWRGLAPSANLTVKIQEANSTPRVSITADPPTLAANAMKSLDRSHVQALGPSLTDLFPVDSQFTLLRCADNGVDWLIKLQFKEGTPVELKSNQSNLYLEGGPLQTRIKNQDYVQVSQHTLKAVHDLITALGLRLADVGAMACFQETMLDKAFPRR